MNSNSNGVLIRYDDDPLGGQTPEAVLDKLRTALTGKVQQAYYFGSFMTDSFSRHSDIDLLLVKESNTPFIERPLEFHHLSDIAPSIDILVYTPQEFRKLTTDPSPGFWRNAVSQMVKFV